MPALENSLIQFILSKTNRLKSRMFERLIFSDRTVSLLEHLRISTGIRPGLHPIKNLKDTTDTSPEISQDDGTQWK